MLSKRMDENFVNQTQTESDKAIQGDKKKKKYAFFACIIDSVMLQGAHDNCFGLGICPAMKI